MQPWTCHGADEIWRWDAELLEFSCETTESVFYLLGMERFYGNKVELQLCLKIKMCLRSTHWFCSVTENWPVFSILQTEGGCLQPNITFNAFMSMTLVIKRKCVEEKICLRQPFEIPWSKSGCFPRFQEAFRQVPVVTLITSNKKKKKDKKNNNTVFVVLRVKVWKLDSPRSLSFILWRLLLWRTFLRNPSSYIFTVWKVRTGLWLRGRHTLVFKEQMVMTLPLKDEIHQVETEALEIRRCGSFDWTKLM